MGVQKPDRPTYPLSILHIILWMIGCAVMFSLYRFNETLRPESDLESSSLLDNYGLIVISVNGMLAGLALAGLLLLPVARYLRAPYPRDPGHWLLIATGFEAVVLMIAWIGFLLSFRPFDNPTVDWRSITHWYHIWQACNILLLGLFSIFFLVRAILTTGGVHWRIVWALFLVRHVIEVLYTTLSLLIILSGFGMGDFIPYPWKNTPPLLLIPVILTAAIIDLIQKQKRDWLHWTGLVAVMFLILTSAAFSIIGFYISESLR